MSAELSTGQFGQDQSLISDYASLLSEVHELRQEKRNSGQSGDLEMLQSRLDALYASSSWRLTAPLRFFFDRFKLFHFSRRR